MNNTAHGLSARGAPSRRVLLDVEWVAILLAIVMVCATAFTLEVVI